uniref:peptidoglycan glycosyltransferase n=1 Tax=Glaucocystis sp. BBH TaxID=2023628 RepID=A0A3G1IUV0_9EUKA|nr:plastid division protein [Glaucocystis sp. BBH]
MRLKEKLISLDRRWNEFLKIWGVIAIMIAIELHEWVITFLNTWALIKPLILLFYYEIILEYFLFFKKIIIFIFKKIRFWVLTVLNIIFKWVKKVDFNINKRSKYAQTLTYFTGLWVLLGLMVLASASYYTSRKKHNIGLYYIIRQLIWGFGGILCSFCIILSPIENILKTSDIYFLTGLVLIFITTIPKIGYSINGARRWIKIGTFLIQPAELMKPLWVIQLGKTFGQWEKLSIVNRFFWITLFLLTILGILLQPNLSTATLFGMTLWFVALVSGINWRFLLTTVIAGGVAGIISISCKEYQKRRLLFFLNPWKDPKGEGYQLIQSLYAIASGQMFGTGLGWSRQKLFYLPIHETDFIFAIFAEEVGFVGCLFFILFLLTYTYFALKVARKTNNLQKKSIAVGCMLILVMQSLLNMGVASGVLPTTGFPLPFFSYGGNALIACLINASILIRIAIEETPHGPYLKAAKRRLLKKLIRLNKLKKSKRILHN